jgi:ABC-type bacteriocin/lantibiotic exporter with double-glycine peptidase domain
MMSACLQRFFLRRRIVTPQLRQAEPAECGLTALAIVMGHHGIHVPLAALRERAGSTRLGLSAQRLLAIAREFGFVAKGFRCEPGELSEIGLPLIAHFRFNHYLIVERVGARRVRVNDPIDGPRSLPIEEFSQGFTGVVLSLAPAAGIKRCGRAFSPGRELVGRLRPVAAPLACAAGWSAASGLFLVAAAGIGGSALDRLVAHRPAADAIALAVLPALAAVATAAAAERSATAAGRAAARRQSGWVLRRLARLPTRYFANRLPAQLAAKLQAAFPLADAAFALAAVQLPALFVLAAAALWFGGWIGAVAVALAGSELIVILGTGLWRGGRIARRERAQLPVVGLSRDMLAAPEGWQVGGIATELFNRLAGHHALALATALRAAEAQAAVDALRALLRTIRLLAVLVLPAPAILFSGARPAAAAALVTIAVALGIALDRFADGFAPARLRRALHDLADLSDAAAMTRARRLGRQAGRLLLLDAAWAPSPAAPPVVAGLSVDLPAGAALAITGPSGSGKSVLARLIAGDLVATAGTVAIGGVAAPALAAGTVILLDRKAVFVAATVRDNLRLGWSADDAALAELLDLVDLGAALAPRGGLDLLLAGQGRELAASERLRLALARALLRRPAVLVLDEILAAFDPPLAARICRAIRVRGTTLVALGRRLPAVEGIDQRIELPGAAGGLAA